MEMPAAPAPPASALPAAANRSGAAWPLLLPSSQPPTRELPRTLGSPRGCPRSPTLHGTPQSLAGASGVRCPSKTAATGPSRFKGKSCFIQVEKRAPKSRRQNVSMEGLGRRGGLEAAHPLWSGACAQIYSVPSGQQRGKKNLCFSTNRYNLSSSLGVSGEHRGGET